MKMKCTYSSSFLFVVGDIYEKTFDKHGYAMIDCFYLDDKELNIHGAYLIASFKRNKEKSILKMLVRAHVNYAKSRGWGDSKNGAFKSWNGTPYNSANDWARCFAAGCDIDAIINDAKEEGAEIDQEYINWFVDEQMSYF